MCALTVPELLNSDMVGRCPEITMPPIVEIVCVEVGGGDHSLHRRQKY